MMKLFSFQNIIIIALVSFVLYKQCSVEDKEIKNEDDSIDKRTGSFHNSNDYWKTALVDIIEQSPRIADLIKTETLIYWRLSNHKANIFKIDESD